MKNKLLILISLILLMAFVSGESYSWQSVNLYTKENIVAHHTFVWFDDTTAKNIGRNKPIDVDIVYTIQKLPYNLSGNELPYNLTGYVGEIDYCNVSIEIFRNIYNSEGNLINTTIEEESYFYNSNSVTTETISKKLYSKDVLFADAKCHYTNPDTLFVEGILFGRIDIYMSSFECNKCEEFSLEELSNEIQRTEEIVFEQESIYTIVQSVIEFNFTIWLIVIWIVKIGLLFVAVGLIFYSVFFIYSILKGVSERL